MMAMNEKKTQKTMDSKAPQAVKVTIKVRKLDRLETTSMARNNGGEF